MGFADKCRKNGTTPSVADIDFKIVETENDFPFVQVDYLRIGSAHAVERNGDREQLRGSLEPMATELRAAYEHERLSQSVVFVEK